MTDPAISEQALEAARSRLNHDGETVQAWAARHAVSPSTVYEVLAGRKKCRRGDAHRVAVLLGLKTGVIHDSTAA